VSEQRAAREPFRPPEDPPDLALAVRLALEAGEILMRGLSRRPSVNRKGWRDLVSETDLESEAAVGRRLEIERPDDGIFAEERLRRPGTSGRVWVVDPLDGTTNFVHGHPMFCVSIALEEAGETLLGAVWAPYLGELFWAARGAGGEMACLPRSFPAAGGTQLWPGARRPLAVTATGRIEDSLIATGFPYSQSDRMNANLDNFSRVTLASRGVRRGGSAALDLAYVACGRFDGFWELYLNRWDVAAAALMVTEAGGTVGDLSGGTRWRSGWEIVASNGMIQSQLALRLEPADPPPRDP
jgi:myo-inositol-1(or 4)-monophosphatase